MTTFKSAFDDLQRKLGKDPAVTLSDPLPAIYSQAIQDALEVAWVHAIWPRLARIEKRVLDTEANSEAVSYYRIPFLSPNETPIFHVDLSDALFLTDPRVQWSNPPVKGAFLMAATPGAVNSTKIDRNILVVSGAGTTATNGTYTWDGVNKFVGSAYLLEADEAGLWRIRDGFTAFYLSSTGNVDDAWTTTGGTDPAPTVAFGYSPLVSDSLDTDIVIPANTGITTTAWLKFLPNPPRFTKTAYSSGTTYAVDDVVFYATTGECYRAIQAGINHVPTTAAYWQKQTFPSFLRKYVILAASAELLSEDKARYRTSAFAETELERLYSQEFELSGVGIKAKR